MLKEQVLAVIFFVVAVCRASIRAQTLLFSKFEKFVVELNSEFDHPNTDAVVGKGSAAAAAAAAVKEAELKVASSINFNDSQDDIPSFTRSRTKPVMVRQISGEVQETKKLAKQTSSHSMRKTALSKAAKERAAVAFKEAPKKTSMRSTNALRLSFVPAAPTISPTTATARSRMARGEGASLVGERPIDHFHLQLGIRAIFVCMIGVGFAFHPYWVAVPADA